MQLFSPGILRQRHRRSMSVPKKVTRMATLPSIVVVDSSKEPEEQRRTQITIYKPVSMTSSSGITTAFNPSPLSTTTLTAIPSSKLTSSTSSSSSAKPNSKKKSSRVQRRIDASKSKISSVTAISKASGGLHAEVPEKVWSSPTNAVTTSTTKSYSGVQASHSSSPKSSATVTSASKTTTSSKPRTGGSKGSKKPQKKASSKGTILKKQSSLDKELESVIARVVEIPYLTEAEEEVPDTGGCILEEESSRHELPGVSDYTTTEQLFQFQEEIAFEKEHLQDDRQTPEDSSEVISLMKPASEPSIFNSDRRLSEEDQEIERIKRQIKRNLKPKNTPEDKAKAKVVVKQLENRVAKRRPTKLDSKWLLWKYQDDDEDALDFMQHQENSSDVGWGRRIYNKEEIESDDRERERMALNDDSMRNTNLKLKDVPEKYGLWDNIYDKRVIRALDCNLQWKPNRREEERRKRLRQKRQKDKQRRRNSRAGGLPEEDYQPFEDSKDKWFATGEQLTDDDMSFIMEHTKFTETAVRKWFANFRQECPNGKLTRNHLIELFKRIFPGGESETFSDHIFRIFDSDGNGFLDFKEFLMALDVTSCRSEREKLEWAFRLYDVDASGSVNLKEITAIMETLDQVEGGPNESSDEQNPDWSEDQNESQPLLAVRRAKEIFDKLDTDCDGELSMEEFVEGYLRMQAQASKKKIKKIF